MASAVEAVSLSVHAGEVLALLGHHGAGKSTLMKILAGAYAQDAGEIRADCRAVDIRSPAQAQALGIETIYQTRALADNLDAVTNLFLGRELLTCFGTLDDDAMEAVARAVFKRLKPNLHNLHVPVRSLSGGQRQVVAISARAVLQCPRADHGRALRRLDEQRVHRQLLLARCHGCTLTVFLCMLAYYVEWQMRRTLEADALRRRASR